MKNGVLNKSARSSIKRKLNIMKNHLNELSKKSCNGEFIALRSPLPPPPPFSLYGGYVSMRVKFDSFRSEQCVPILSAHG